MTKDPILFESGDTNFYVYSRNDAVNFIDPSGLSDLPLFKTGSRDFMFDSKIRSDSNDFSVGAHGKPSSVDDKNGNPLSAKDLAGMIRNSKGYKKGQSVRLNACSTGQGADSFAQQLATELGVKVIAPTDILDVTEYGSTSIQNGGIWKQFLPAQ